MFNIGDFTVLGDIGCILLDILYMGIFGSQSP